MNHEFFGLTYCFISIFQHVPSSFHSFSAQFHSFPVRFHPIFSAVWALIYLHITWFLNHSQALCWSVWSKWAVSLWPKKSGCKAQLLGGGVCWCWSQFLFIPAKEGKELQSEFPSQIIQVQTRKWVTWGNTPWDSHEDYRWISSCIPMLGLVNLPFSMGWMLGLQSLTPKM